MSNIWNIGRYEVPTQLVDYLIVDVSQVWGHMHLASGLVNYALVKS